MKNTKVGDSKMRRAVALLLLCALLLGYQNCAQQDSSSFDQSSLTAEGGGGTVGTTGVKPPIVVSAREKAVAVIYSENILTAMQSQVGLTTLSNNTLNVAQSQITKVSETAKADSVTAPMWIAITNLSGEVCSDLLNQEVPMPASSRRIFGMVDFTKGPVSLTNAIKDDVVRRLARSLWGRNETADEKILLKAAIDEAFTPSSTDNKQTKAEMLFICSSMLASLESQKQ